ncbi:MAG: ABC transporter permease [Chloroflexi bacterium]|jgi:peptide/nickel transport system permease protein|nr:MAG: binding-protein-dependent transport system inner membrane protein [Chloroflexi bacterium OLB13]MBC6954969.1 ABC transporter permease [Chloroflexota bacterium]MBV6437393.1 Dipeptide transport system permease protein DppB [Anaerolineae bacterium]MDL1914686.1 ABC transporter permease [Anaerolineae bacterium CFX4]OQY83362.1 MAG: peptide ABC transporter permease [Anaerolineae bacterium UTCFX5]
MNYLLRRLGFYLIAALLAIVINFFLPRMMAGDPVDVMLAGFDTSSLTPEAIDQLREAFGFIDAPLPEQFATYVSNLLKGNFGVSVARYPTKVVDILGVALRWTLLMTGTALILTFSVGVLLGIQAAWKRGGFVDTYVLPFGAIMGAIPYFWVALIALYVFALQLGWFPLGRAEASGIPADWTNPNYVMGVVYHLALPVLTLLIAGFRSWMMGMRNNMVAVIAQDYITMAIAKGLPDRRIKYQYAARNAILPSLTGFALALGFLLGGSLLTEVVFSYPGVGLTLLNAVNTRDYPVMQGIFLILTLMVLLANFIADSLYILLDPRTRS